MKRIFLLIVVALIFNSCDSNDDSPVEELDAYGLKIGNSWEYKYYRYNCASDGSIIDKVDSGVVEKREVVGTEEINGVQYFKLKYDVTGVDSSNTFLFPENGVSYKYFRNEGDELIEYINGDEYFRFSYANYNEQLVSVNDWGDIYIKLNEELVPIGVGLNSLDCFEMEIYAKNSDGVRFPGTSYEYYYPSIGFVKSIIAFSSGSVIGEGILVSYNIN